MSLGISPEKVYQQVNKVREKAGLHQLDWDNDLASLALDRAKELYETKQFTHESAKGMGKYGTTTDFDLVGENLARKFRNSENMVRAWNESPTHRKNMLQNFTDTGVATYGNVTVQLFARRKTSQPQPEPKKSVTPKTKLQKKKPAQLFREPKSSVKTTTPSVSIKKK